MSEYMGNITDSNEDSDVTRTVEVRGEMLRRCRKCRVVVEGELREFRWDDVKQAYFACGWQMPPGWSQFIHFKKDGSGPWSENLCPACTKDVEAFISGARCCDSPDDGHLVGCRNWMRR